MEHISSTDKLVFATAVHCAAVSFKDTIGDHPIAPQLQIGIEKTWAVFGVLFNRAVELYAESLSVPSQHLRLWEHPQLVSATDNKAKVVDGHYHEMMDRVSCLNVIFYSLVVQHRAAELLQPEVDRVGEELDDLYQQAGQLYVGRT